MAVKSFGLYPSGIIDVPMLESMYELDILRLM